MKYETFKNLNTKAAFTVWAGFTTIYIIFAIVAIFVDSDGYFFLIPIYVPIILLFIGMLVTPFGIKTILKIYINWANNRNIEIGYSKFENKITLKYLFIRCIL